MFDDLDETTGKEADDQAFDLLQELERNTPAEIRRQRAHHRVAVKARITLRPGNASQRSGAPQVEGTSGDVSTQGLGALFAVPTRVGDIYHLEFDQKKLALPRTFARCVRCRLVRDEAYEAGFQFFTPVRIPDRTAAGSGA